MSLSLVYKLIACIARGVGIFQQIN